MVVCVPSDQETLKEIEAPSTGNKAPGRLRASEEDGDV